MTSQSDAPVFQKPRHIKYWLRCLKTLLPTVYMSNDTQRMTLAFFTLSALDLLSAFDKHVSSVEKDEYVDWIYRCQHEQGGFKGFTGASTGEEHCWDPANLAATFFALASLMVLGDDFARVRSSDCLSWVRRLQREDGSFGEAIGKDGVIEGSGDIRYCYLAAAVRHILRRKSFKADLVEDINVNILFQYVRNSITYEGGIGKSPFQEAHAGWTYCGIGVFQLLGRLPSDKNTSKSDIGTVNDVPMHQILFWLVSRQTSFISEEEEEGEEEGEDDHNAGSIPSTGPSTFQKERSYPATSVGVAQDAEAVEIEKPQCAGFNGRCNKIADSCYAFWVGASLAMLGHSRLQDLEASKRYLLEKAQHMIGGFGKLVGDPPDILHSYLSLAALATMKHPDLGEIDPTLCISLRAYQSFDTKFPIR